MPSESAEGDAVTVELPPELDAWLDEQSATLGVDRETLVTQLLASYRATIEFEGSSPPFDIDRAVEEAMGDRLDAVVAATVDDAIESRLDERVQRVEDEFQTKIEDVRERVIQLKHELDDKATADHGHEKLEAIDDLEAEMATLRRDLDGLSEEFEDALADHAARVDDAGEQIEAVDARLDELEEKLTRVAWVVSDLREEQGGQDAHQQALDRLKRAAAQEGVSTATCENCEASVDIALLTDPQCPHCGSTVSDVRPEGGIIRKKARLLTAAQLSDGSSDE